KAPPFSSFPSQAELYIDGEFHSYIGCASEAMAVSNMPPFQDKECRIESFCACCLAPITIIDKAFKMMSCDPEGVLWHVNKNPWDWGNVDMGSMCDSMNFVLDAEHARNYEMQTGTRGVFCSIEAGKEFVRYTATIRMHDYNWPPGIMDPPAIIERFRSLGCDVSIWGA
ncbi:MAG: organomercurial lyase, partial [Isosphaeraceae bacterium]